jgi:hypothetical protein
MFLTQNRHSGEIFIPRRGRGTREWMKWRTNSPIPLLTSPLKGEEAIYPPSQGEGKGGGGVIGGVI